MIVSYKLCINTLVEPVKVDIKRAQICVVSQMSEAETGIIFLIMNVKRFKGSFFVASFYMQLYANKKFRVGKFQQFFGGSIG